MRYQVTTSEGYELKISPQNKTNKNHVILIFYIFGKEKLLFSFIRIKICE